MPSTLPRIVVRAKPEQVEAWRAAAGAGGVSAWAARTLDQAVARKQAQPVAVEISDALRVEAARKPRRDECPRGRHHRAGVFCKGCGLTP